MSNFALAYSSGRTDARRSRLLRQSRTRPVRTLRPWSEIAVAGTPLQAISGHPAHIKRRYWAILIVIALVLHAGAAWYLAQHSSPRFVEQRQAELNIELVRPPKPEEPPKVEPPKPVPPRPQPQHAQVLPQIQQSTQEPSTAGESSEAPIAVAAVVAAAPEPEPAPVTAPVGRAGYLNNPAPDYPAMAVRAGWQGTVLLRVRVLSTGKVETVEVKQSSGRKILDDEAIRTVKQWLFTPSKRGDIAIDGWATVPIEFQLG